MSATEPSSSPPPVGIPLSQAQKQYRLTAKVCEKLPADTVVLSRVEGRANVRLINDVFPEILYVKGDFVDSEARDNAVKHFSKNGGVPFLRELCERDPKLKENLMHVIRECSANAIRYGFDTMAHTALSHGVSATGRGDEFRGVLLTWQTADPSSLILAAHVNICVAHSPSTGEVFCITQNLAACSAAEKLQERVAQVNAVAREGLTDEKAADFSLPGMSGVDRPADATEQPLLQKGAPIGAGETHLTETYQHQTGGIGFFSLHGLCSDYDKITSGEITAGHEAADLRYFAEHPYNVTGLALSMACAASGLTDEDIRLVTVCVPLKSAPQQALPA